MKIWQPPAGNYAMKNAEPNYIYLEITRDEAIEKCLSLDADDRSWHIHSLVPGCRYNHRPGQYCFVIEDTDNGLTWCAFSDQNFKQECHQLVQVLHGSSILDSAARPEGFEDPEILESVKHCVKTSEAWHHHMMKPGCILSPLPERHVITLERATSARVEVYASDKPTDDVQREIELLYFSQSNA